MTATQREPSVLADAWKQTGQPAALYVRVFFAMGIATFASHGVRETHIQFLLRHRR